MLAPLLAVLTVLAVSLAGCAAPVASPVGTPAVTLELTAHNIAFDKTQLSVPADATFAILLDNEDSVPHNVVISGNGVNQGSAVFSGPASRTYLFAGLPPGTYTFTCQVHPEMHGTITSVAESGSAP
jgi:plastocyanin